MSGDPELIEKIRVGKYEGQVVEWGGHYFAQVKLCVAIDQRGPAFERAVEMVQQVVDPEDFKRAKGRIERQIELFKEHRNG